MPLKKKRGSKRTKPSAAYTKDAKVRSAKARFNNYDTTHRQRKMDVKIQRFQTITKTKTEHTGAGISQ